MAERRCENTPQLHRRPPPPAQRSRRHPRYAITPDAHPTTKETAMLKFLGSAVGIIFLIGLLVVIGLLALIF